MFWVCNYKATLWDSLEILLQNPQDWYKLIDDQHFILFASLKKWHFKKVTKKKIYHFSPFLIWRIFTERVHHQHTHTHTVLMCPTLYCTIHQHAVRHDLQLEKGKEYNKENRRRKGMKGERRGERDGATDCYGNRKSECNVMSIRSHPCWD